MAEDMKPMLASASTGASGRRAVDVATLVDSGEWVLDLKLDGIRAFMREGRLLNRRGVDITVSFPEVMLPEHNDLWLDGEIVALDGKFETVATRDKTTNATKVRARVESMPCKFVAFDLPGMAGEPWSARRFVLEQQGLTTTPISYDLAFIDRVRDMGLEGVIAKRIASRYQYGRRSKDWIKFKFTHRVSCLIAGYEPGTGSRKHFGAMVLALLDQDGQVVPVGRVGTGFTMKQSWELKSMLDAQEEIHVAEIECLNVTSGGTLRFPVFRGLRTDVPTTACTTAQLDAIPRSAKE